MKEATGELSTTVITVVAIAAISTLFVVFLLPTLRRQIILNQGCNNGPGYSAMSGDKARISCGSLQNNNTYKCTYYENANANNTGGTVAGEKTCTNK